MLPFVSDPHIGKMLPRATILSREQSVNCRDPADICTLLHPLAMCNLHLHDSGMPPLQYEQTFTAASCRHVVIINSNRYNAVQLMMSQVRAGQVLSLQSSLSWASLQDLLI